MEITITCICDNNKSRPDLKTVHGLSLFLKLGDKKIIFDTDSGKTLISNLKALNKSAEEIDGAILSHGHFDHTGGLRPLLYERVSPLPVYVHPHIFSPKYKRMLGFFPVFIGTKFDKNEYEKFGARFQFNREPHQLAPDIWLSGEIPLLTKYEYPAKRFFVERNGASARDWFIEEQALYIKKDDGMIVITGCAHRGVVNTVLHGLEVCGTNNVKAVIGGFHLMSAKKAKIDQVIQALKVLKVSKFVPLHCTGQEAVERFKEAFPGRVITAGAGSVLNL